MAEVMGILNCTPDSFFAGSRKQSEEEIASRAVQIIAEGATSIDLGACSTRPGSAPVSAEEEARRLCYALPIIRREFGDEVVVSVDTFRPAIAQMCIERYGVQIINDVSEGSEDMFDIVGKSGVQYILMSCQATMETTRALFDRQLAALRAAGCSRVILDPGYGFGKDVAENYALIRRQEELREYGLPILAGISRKRLIWQLLGSTPDEALNGTSVVNALCLLHGADILRVHDVRQAVETIKICSQILA